MKGIQLKPKTIWSRIWQGMWRAAGTSTGVWIAEERLGKWKVFAEWSQGAWGQRTEIVLFFAHIFSSEI